MEKSPASCQPARTPAGALSASLGCTQGPSACAASTAVNARWKKNHRWTARTGPSKTSGRTSKGKLVAPSSATIRYLPGPWSAEKSPIQTVWTTPVIPLATDRAGPPPTNSSPPSLSRTTRKLWNWRGALNCFGIEGAYPTWEAARCANGGSSTRIAWRLRTFHSCKTRFAARLATPEAKATPTAPAATAAMVAAVFLFILVTGPRRAQGSFIASKRDRAGSW